MKKTIKVQAGTFERIAEKVGRVKLVGASTMKGCEHSGADTAQGHPASNKRRRTSLGQATCVSRAGQNPSNKDPGEEPDSERTHLLRSIRAMRTAAPVSLVWLSRGELHDLSAQARTGFLLALEILCKVARDANQPVASPRMSLRGQALQRDRAFARTWLLAAMRELEADVRRPSTKG